MMTLDRTSCLRRAGLLMMIAVCGASALSAQPSVSSSFASYDQKIPGTDIAFRMVAIPGGTYMMGSPATETGRHDDEGPQATVKVDSFWIEEHEVSYDEYILFQDEKRDSDPRPDGITRPSPPYVDFTLGMGKDGGFPANSMTQYAALMYCQWLYGKTGIFYRLPTEAEWEYACRAGTRSAYPFEGGRSVLGEYAWYGENSDNKYHKIKQRKPNAWGLYDMLGNVAEWTLDQYDEHYFKTIVSSRENPRILPTAKHPRTLKGGHFRDEATDLRSAARLRSNLQWNARDPQIPKSKWWNADAPFIGFRVIRPVKQPSPEEVERFFQQMLAP